MGWKWQCSMQNAVHWQGKLSTTNSDKGSMNENEYSLCEGNVAGIINLDFLKDSETLNAHLYLQQLQCQHKIFVVKHPELCQLQKMFPPPWQRKTACSMNNTGKVLELGWSVLSSPAIVTWNCTKWLLPFFSILTKFFHRKILSSKSKIQVGSSHQNLLSFTQNILKSCPIIGNMSVQIIGNI